jgi:peptidyl-prolyl cis-trans isomerase SurA
MYVVSAFRRTSSGCKMKAAKTVRSIAVAALVALAVAGLRADVIEQVLVKVNGEIFTKTDLEARQIAALRQMGQQADQKTNLSDAQLRKMLDDVTPQLMVNIVDEILLVQRGHELGYTMSNERFQSIVDSIKKDNKIETEEDFQAALKQENMTLSDLRKNLEKQMIVSQVQQNEVLSRIAISDEEARRYYDSHKNEFTSPQTVTLREIFVQTPGDGVTLNVGRDEETREKAEMIRKRAIDGESFEKLASDFSDAPSKANAGLIGPLNLNDLSQDIKSLLAPMKPGDITQVLRAPKGYQILKLESISAAEVMPFDKAKDQISDRVFTGKRTEEFQKYLEKLRSQAIIEWKNPELKKAYEEGLKLPPKAQ